MGSVYWLYLILLYSCVLYGFIYFKRLLFSYKLFVLFLLTTAISESLSSVFTEYLGYNTILYHFYIPIQILFNGAFYSLNNGTSKPFYTQTRFHIALFLSVSCFFNSIFVQSVKFMPTYSLFLLVLFIVPVVLLSYKKMLLEPSQISILQQPLFWINFGNIFFYTITLFSLSFMLIAKSKVSIDLSINILVYTNFILYTAFFNALRLASKKRKRAMI